MTVSTTYFANQFRTEKHNFFFICACQVPQQCGFWMAICIGAQILAGYRKYIDEATELRCALLERRVEQLTREKERLDYDRKLLQKQSRREQAETQDSQSLGSAERTSVSALSGPAYVTSETSARLAEHNTSDRDDTEQQPDSTPCYTSLEPGTTLPANRDYTANPSGAASTSGWTDLSRAIRSEQVAMNSQGPQVAGSGQGWQLQPTLNPTAPSWVPDAAPKVRAAASAAPTIPAAASAPGLTHRGVAARRREMKPRANLRKIEEARKDVLGSIQQREIAAQAQ